MTVLKHIKTRKIIPGAAVLALSLLTACGQSGTTSEGGDDPKLGTSVPSAIRASTLPDSSLLRAFLDVNGARNPMTISGGAAETTVANLLTGASTVAIVFDYQSPNFGDVVLATATQMLSLQPGQNSLAFDEQDYQFPDDDGDGSNNLAEIKNGTDPGDPNELLRQWNTASHAISSASNASPRSPSLAVDVSGNGLAVWSQIVGGIDNIQANRFEPDAGWGAAAPLQFDTNAGGFEPHVALDANGNGVAVWLQGGSSVLARPFDPASGWGTLARLDPESTENLIPGSVGLAMNTGGVAVAVWRQRDDPVDGQTSIWANRYDPATGWDDATVIDNSIFESAGSPEVAVDVNGNALVIWSQNENLWANRYIADTGWGTPVQIETLEGGIGVGFDVAMDSNGNGMAVWVQTFQLSQMVRAIRFEATTSMWGDAILIESGASLTAGPLHVAFDTAGNALAIWSQAIPGVAGGSIWANRFDAVTTAWGSATLIEDMDTLTNLELDGALAVRANGEAWAVWGQSDGTLNKIYANRFDPVAQAWGTPVLVENSSFGAILPKIALADDGRGLAVWRSGNLLSDGGSSFAVFSNGLQ